MYRFFAPDFKLDSDVQLSEEESRHLSRVLRLKSGDIVAVFDGKGREGDATVLQVTPGRVTVRVTALRSPAAEPVVKITLAQALLKSDKMDRVIRDAVMLGVAAVQPLVSRRTDVPLKAVTKGGRQERWDRTVIATVKQCGRAVVPPVHETRELDDVLQSTTGWTRLMFVEPRAGVRVADLASLEGRRPSEAILFVGPEGGWETQEMMDAAAAGVTLLTLGQITLRADATAAAAVAVLRYVWRDL